jgi:hypothetical protein
MPTLRADDYLALAVDPGQFAGASRLNNLPLDIQGTPFAPPALCCSTKPPFRPCNMPSKRSMPAYAAGCSL